MNIQKFKDFLAKLKLPAAILALTATTLLVIPQFSFNTNGQTFSYPDVGFNLLGFDSRLGKPTQGTGIFNSQIVTATIVFNKEDSPEQVSKDLLNEVNKRISLSGLYDITADVVKVNDKYKLRFNLPSHYNNPLEYVRRLTTKGEIKFTTGSNSTSTPVNLSVHQIEGFLRVAYENLYGNHLAFDFNKDQDLVLTQIFYSNSQNLVQMEVDGQQSYYVVPFISRNTSSSNPEISYLRAIPLIPNSTEKETIDQLNILKTYFSQEKPLSNDIFVENDSLTTLGPTYAYEGFSLILGVFVGAIALVLLVNYITPSFRAFVKMLISLFSVLLTTVLVLKFLSANISIALILGLIIGAILTIITIKDILNSTNDYTLKEKFATHTNINLIVIFCIIILSKLTSLVGLYTDLLGALAAISLSIIVCIYTYFRVFLRD